MNFFSRKFFKINNTFILHKINRNIKKKKIILLFFNGMKKTDNENEKNKMKVHSVVDRGCRSPVVCRETGSFDKQTKIVCCRC